MNGAEHPYAPFLHRVQKPGQYLGGEPGERRKDWARTETRVCLAFPDLYEIGMSHLGFKILYKVLNDHPKLLAERTYAVWPDMERELRAHGELLRSLESARPLRDFDVVGISLQFELTYTNLLQVLDLGGIAMRSSERDEAAPLVLAGGPSATHPEVLAPFVDAFVVGDGEEKAQEVALTWTALRRAGVPRAGRLAALARLGGVYVPSLHGTHVDPDSGLEVVDAPTDASVPYPIRRAFLPDISAYPFPSDSPVPATKAIFDRIAVEIARGCTEGCRFCQAGMIYRPVRERDPTQILETITDAVSRGGYDEASLSSLSTADYSAIAPLVRRAVEELRDRRVTLSVSSLRAYGLAEPVLDDLAGQEASGLTFAPEAGTQRMRDVINKNVTEAQLLETAERVFSRGWSKMKLYFMIGLPTEEDEDVLGIAQTGLRTQAIGRRILGRGRAKVTVSVSTHVPKPHTPFQWCALDSLENIHRKQRLVLDAVRGTDVRLRKHDPSGTWIEGVLARGDRRLGAVLLRAYELGARFDSWESELDPVLWQQAFEHCGIDPSDYLRTLPTTARLPLDHIDVGLEPGFLAREYRRALAGRLSPPCGKMVGQFVHATDVEAARAESGRLVCYHCGVACDLDAMREERVEKLVALSALTGRRPSAPEPTLERAEGARDRRIMRGVDQGPKVRLRIGYRKVGAMAWSGHLDVLKLFPRVFRRAELPVVLSEGFAATLVVSYGPALALGVPSLGEYLDLELRVDALGERDARTMLERLERASFEGLEILGCAFLGPTDASITRVLGAADYVAAVPRAVLPELGLLGPEELAERVRGRAALPSLLVRRDHKGIGKEIDVRSYLLDVRPLEGTAALRAAGFEGDLVPVSVRTELRPSGGVRPYELAEALLDADESRVRVLRAGTYAIALDGTAVSPLEVARFRKPRTASSPLESHGDLAP